MKVMKRNLNGDGGLSEVNGRTMELTCLLEECRMMNEGRDEEMIARIRPKLRKDESN
jgi:hypothetical protein